MTGYDESKITKDKLYESAKNLYQLKDQLEKHLSHKTNTLFDIQDKILLYDLTNTYFEGTMRGSTLARYGKSKEKRNDAKLVVLALVVNIHGFLKYSSILEGNTADCTTLEQMINKIQNHTSSQKGIVVIDAGIATKENLNYLQQSGYQYVCVNRVNLKNYEAVQGKEQVILQTKNKNEVRIQAISTDISTDYYLRIKSQAKALKESGMKNRFEQRYVEEIQKIAKAVHQKGGVKKISKVYERIGRAKQKYPTAHKLFEIQIETTPSNTLVTNLSWKRITHIEEQVNENLGVYFLRTNLKIDDEKTIWNIYNTIREIESTFRTLKTDLDLRPIFHKTDVASMAHLHLGILAYWLVNTIRHQLKSQGFKNSWQEIVRIANTQKMITTSGTNDQQHIISIRKCSTPEQNLSQIQSILRINSKPFRKRKSVVHKIPPNLFFPSESQHFTLL